MTEKEFMVFVQKYLNETIYPTMIGKGPEQYSTHEDRFHNFKKLAGLKGETKEKCLTDLVAKQIVYLFDTMKDEDFPFMKTPHGIEILDEVIKDIIIYMFLLRGMIYEWEISPQQESCDNPDPNCERWGVCVGNSLPEESKDEDFKRDWE